MSMTPEEFLERTNAVREIAGAFGFLYEIVRDFRNGFVETSGMGGETADLLAAQLFQTMILPRILDGAAASDAGEIKLRAAAHRALEVLDLAAPPVSLHEVQQAVDLLREALGDGT